ncbi:hypothetical protein GCM10018775_92760 [Streptomyces umbrinus]|nr:hypothetical protein GCM10018775_92760 [Streptomyces umbrinus]
MGVAGVARQVSRRSAALLGLLVLAVMAAIVLDAQQLMSPRLEVARCPDENRWLARSSADRCVWDRAVEAQVGDDPEDSRDVEVRALVEERDRLPRITITVTVPESGPIANAMRESGATRPGLAEAFVSAAAGGAYFDMAYTAWSPPTMRPSGTGRVAITTSGDALLADRDALRKEPYVQVEFYAFSHPVDLTVRTTDRSIVASHMPPKGTKVATRRLTARLTGDGGPWTVTLGAYRIPDHYVDDTARTTPSWWQRVAPLVRGVLDGWGQGALLLLGAVPWFGLLIASHTVGFGSMDRRPEWRALLRLTGLVLAVHLCVVVTLTNGLGYEFHNLVISDKLLYQRLDTWVPWSREGNVGVPGTTVLLVAAALSLLPAAARRAVAAPPGCSTGCGGLLSLGMLGFVTWAVSTAHVTEWTFREGPRQNLAALALYGGVPLVLAFLAVLARPLLRVLRGPDAPAPPRLSGFVLTAVAVAVFATYYGYFGYLAWAARWIILLLAGTATLYQLCVVWLRIAFRRRPERRTRAWLVVAALIFSVPWWYASAWSDAGWELYVSLAQEADGLLSLLLVTAVVVTLRRTGRRDVVSTERLRGHRVMGMALAVIVLSNSYSFFRAPSFWALLAAACGVVLLLPAAQVDRAAELLAQDTTAHRRALSRTVLAGAARRQLGAARRLLRDKTAEDASAGGLTGQQRALRRLEVVAWQDRETHGGDDVTVRQRALGALASRSPWHRGMWGARWGFVFGLPWVALDLAGTARLSQDDPYPLLTATGSLVPTLLTWAGLGLFFGYFFPLIGGHSGLGKAMRLTAAAAAPTLLDTVLLAQSSRAWPASLLAVVQLLAFGTSMGLLADRTTLATERYPWARLADVHNLGSLTAWASSVTAALATTVATLILVGVQPFVTQLVEPPATTTPTNLPASTSSP